MRVTFILKNLSETFYHGNGGAISGLLNRTDAEKFEYLNSSHARDLSITCQVGNHNTFRDRIELNQLRRSGCHYAFKLEPRRGYKLASFEITKA